MEETWPVYSLRGPAVPPRLWGLPPVGAGGALYLNDRDDIHSGDVRPISAQEVFTLSGGTEAGSLSGVARFAHGSAEPPPPPVAIALARPCAARALAARSAKPPARAVLDDEQRG